MSDIFWNVTVTGTEEAGKELAQKLNAEVVDAAALLEIHKQRDEFAVAYDAPYENPDATHDPRVHSPHLWQEHNWGINPAALREGGLAFKMKFSESHQKDSEAMPAVLLLRLISAEHPNLLFDAQSSYGT